MSTQKRPGGPAAAAPPKRQNMADDEDEDFPDEEEMLAMEEEMADEAGQDVDGPAPPDEEVAACLTKTQFAACAKQWTRPAPRPSSRSVAGLGRIAALRHRPSASYQNRYQIRCLCF